MVRTIRVAADELQAATALPASGRGRGRIGADPLGFLTPRELQVLDALSNGASTSDLATRFALSTSTVRSYIKSILNKLGAHSRLEAVALLRKLEAGRTAPDRAGWPGSSPRSA
jgi:DNA-binding NarL/FixJ family response regulator